MKTKDALNALKQKTMAELETDLKDKKSELLNLRFQLATGQLENTAAINQCKKDHHAAARAGREGIRRQRKHG